MLASALSITAAWPSPNTDGIDLRGTNINIQNCYISDGDDLVQIGGSQPTSGVTVQGCTFGTGHGLSIGSITSGGVSNVLVDNCVFNGTQYGLRLKADRTNGGTVSNITYSNITMSNIMVNPILFYSYYPTVPSSPTTDTGSTVTSTTPFWNNVTFENVSASEATTSTANSGIIWGLPEAPVTNVLFDACTITGSKAKVFEVYNTQGVTFDCNCLINGLAPSNTAAVTTYNIALAGADDVAFPTCAAANTATETSTNSTTATSTSSPTLTPTTPTMTNTATPTTTNSPTRTTTPIAQTGTFARGSDVSWVSQMVSQGIPFYNTAGVQENLFQVLQGNCINAIRLRVWVNPAAPGWNGQADVVSKATQAAAMGYRILIDFHYSDTWADPGDQNKPAAWANYTFAQLQQAVSMHTNSVLSALAAAGVTPEWVQVGNETNNGMLWAAATDPAGTPSGEVVINGVTNFTPFAQLVNSGYAAVKAVFPNAKVIIHISNGYDNALFEWMFDGLKAAGANWDVIGMSLYPSTTNYTTLDTECQANMQDMTTRYGKPVMNCEVGMAVSDPTDSEAFLTDIINKNSSLPGGMGLGVFYWEPESYNNWQGYTMGAFGNNGEPTAAMNAFGTGCVLQTPTAANTAIATPTNTASNTATQTTTNTASSTATSSATSTVTNSATHTDTNTATQTPTNTATLTPAITSTFTNTATNTASSTTTNSATSTATHTATNTSTTTTTNTPTQTVTNTPTLTPAITSTFTNTATITSSNTESSTATNTPTSTATHTSTNTVTTTTTNTATQTTTNTATLTPANTGTFTNTATHTSSSTATNTPTPTATNTTTHTATTTPTVKSTYSKTNTPTATLTSTLTNTFTPTGTPNITPTYTPTITSQIIISAPFPNPSNGTPITFNIQVSGESTVTLDVFTLTFRKIYSETIQADGPLTLQWDLKDVSGVQVANGVYFVRIHVSGSQSATKILKVIILR